MQPTWVNEYIPFTGPCLCCGGDDSRHRIIDAMVGQVDAGDSTYDVAFDFGYTTAFIERLVSWSHSRKRTPGRASVSGRAHQERRAA